jgi:hypothetical protein
MLSLLLVETAKLDTVCHLVEVSEILSLHRKSYTPDASRRSILSGVFSYWCIIMQQLVLFDIANEVDKESLSLDKEEGLISEDTKICRICKLEKSKDDFFLDRGKLYSKCRDCFKKYHQDLKEVHKNAPEKPDRCECCNKIPTKWACDHHPNSTIFRGWVCWECNNAAGSIGDSHEGAFKLFNYLSERQLPTDTQ